MKTPRKVFCLLADVYRMFGEYDRRDFELAMRQRDLPEEFRRVLDSFASVSNRLTFAGSKVRSPRTTFPSSLTSDKDYWVALLQNSDFARSNQALAELGRLYGLKLPFDRKDSKSRVMKRLASAIVRMPDDMRRDMRNRLTHSTDAQTEGWIDVIKSSR
jgi:hypothetical protein